MAARRVRLSDEAAEDLDAIYRWQTQPGAGTAAVRRLKTIGAVLRRLQRTPCLYAKGEQPGTREASIEGHRVIYRVDPDTGHNATAGDVLVLAIFGPGQSRDSL